jgi:glycopeptide antibiotics resistance protein
MSSRLGLALWVGLIIAVVVPWTSFQNHAHWERVDWIPFTAPSGVFDAGENVLFYVPYGYLLARKRAASRRVIGLAFGSASMLAVCTELTQVFSATRFPSTTDIISNATGALIGASWAVYAGRNQRSEGEVAK